ncbi:SPP1 gp7 family putative phage head morphogenesis protein [Mucilaginibacter gracilis]|uniref:SPP1 gp7 family putative phage head morphogenesis protein n=1 Tax=Mucilaginibacter gracilis TaxID=423350 RepID=A0A495J3F1_9SPHI|nr:phage minor head protein [Mucilaginibacter gracilis]RKR83201.1 SPP1 gp7 family putative phage head morphogenesis protein [Mucilaginibacter gracilis]
MYSCVCPRCGGNKYPDAAADEEKLSDLFGPDIKRICAQLYSGKLQAGNIDLKSARKVATVISQAILKGFGKEFPKLDFDTPDFEMYSHIEKQVWQFSFAKNYEELKAASLALQTGNQVTPWGEFKSIVERINGDYNVRNLKTEYDTGIGSAQMAARWVQYIADEVKLLKYQTVGDSRVRPSHQELDGIIRKITDAFWSLYYPPNGWRCRCDAIDAGNAKETPQSKIVTPTDVPPMFRRNLAKEGLAFPPDHPYFEHVPDDILQAADNNNPFIYDRQYSSDKGGSVWVSNLHGAGELKDNLAIAKFYADRGDMVTLMPSIDPNSPSQLALRKMTLPDSLVKSKLNADAKINGRTNEFKTNHEGTVNSLKMQVRKGLKQAQDVTIAVSNDTKPARIKKAIKDQVYNSYKNRAEELKGRTITVLRKGKATVYKLDKIVK